jgi:penicillin amidase
MRRGLATAACLLLAATPASAEVKRAESIMPPGQSGFVSAQCLAETQAGTGGASCDPHLTDQVEPFVEFRLKSSMLDQKPGPPEVPRPGVRIYRDAYGVPSVYGDTDADAWWGVGYAVAQDRLFQIELFRRATTGRLSEILGRGYLEDDIVARRDYYTEAERMEMLNTLSGELRERWQAYADGVNAWIAEVRQDPNKMPAEFAAVGLPQGPADVEVHEMVALGVFLARTVPSDDGEELNNLRAFQAVGAKVFDRVFPLRTPGQNASVPRANGVFPSRPGRTRRDERIALRRSARYASNLPLPKAEGSASTAAAAPRFRIEFGGSHMWTMRKGGRTWLWTGPQLGYSIPELLVEVEIHSPTLDVRGTTAPLAPVIGIGHNEHVAWGVTSGLSDEDDLYAEQLVGDEGYRFRGRVEAMDCRDETFTYRPPPTDLLPLTGGEVPDNAEPGTHEERVCRTVHGPVQLRVDGIAYARRYALWKQELGTFLGLDRVNRARSIEDVDAAADLLTWNENLMAADDSGNIGYWHPGLLPVRPKRWDERLPFPGTGRAEWTGLLRPSQRPQVVNPQRGWLHQWNNQASVGWTNGDGPAKEKTTGLFHRGRLLARTVAAEFRSAGLDAMKRVERYVGTHAQQRVLATPRLRRARRGARGDARVVLDAILRWDGDYHTTDSDGKVPPGVAAWDAFCAAARKVATAPYPEAVGRLGHGAGGSHLQECATLEAFGLRVLGRRGYRRAAVEAMTALAERFDSKQPSDWKVGRPMYSTSALGAGDFPDIPFFDRGTWIQVVELGP